MNILRHLPNALTLTNLLLGMIAILIMPHADLLVVFYLFIGCLLADILDGAVARKLGVDGTLGVQLDSLADLVSFGVLPAIILYKTYASFDPLGANQTIHVLSFAFVAVSAGLRLARFNVDSRPKDYFWGLPTPAGAILMMTIGWIGFGRSQLMEDGKVMQIIILCVALFLVVSYHLNVRLPGLKSPRKGRITLMVLVGLMLLGFILNGPMAIAAGIVLYVLLGIVNLALKWY